MSSVSQRFKPKGRPTPRCSTDGGFLLHQLSAWPARGTFLDDGLAKGIAQLVGNATVLDVGAGSGQYGAWFHELRGSGRDAPRWRGIDGASGVAEFTRRLGPPGAETDYVNLCDASAAARLPTHDWAMSLEVGEHIPPRCLTSYLHLLHTANRFGIILTWSTDCGSGTCHISCREQRDVVSLFEFLNYRVDESASRQLRAGASLGHIKRTLLILRRGPEPVLKRGPHGLADSA